MSAIGTVAMLCVALAGLLIVLGAHWQAGKAFGAAVIVLVSGALVALPNAIWTAMLHGMPNLSFWTIIAVLPFAALFAIFVVIRIFQFVIARIYGHHVSVRITTHALLSTFRVVGGFFGLILSLPARLFTRRQRMDEQLRDWRRR